MQSNRTTKWLLIAIGVIVLLATAAVALIAPKWPFREAELKKRLERSTGTHVDIGHFHQTFLPHPGAVAEDVTLTSREPSHPKITVKKIALEGLYSGLIGSETHIRMLSLDGMRIEFPPMGAQPPEAHTKSRTAKTPSGVKFDLIRARNSQIVFPPTGKSREPRTYDLYDVILKSFAPGEAIRFNAVLRIPTPPAEVTVDGEFGPLTGGEVGEAPLKGRFTMKDANLGTFHALMGTLSAQGEFEGPLNSLTVHGTTDAPNFGTRNTKHSIPLRTDFTARVDGTSGDAEFQPVHALLGETKLTAHGNLEDAPGGSGKLLRADIASEDARIQDLMYLFVHSKPPLQGTTRFRMTVELPPEKRPFEERVRITAQFGIVGSKFTKQQTQEKVSELSEKAKGNPKNEDPPMVVTNLLGDVKLAEGTAKFSRLNVSVPGASAALHGSYRLQNHAVDLRGTLHTDAKLSDATTGFKAFLMKVVELAKKQDKNGATVPVKITGTYEKPEFGLDATAEK